MIISTTPNLEGKKIKKYLGIVSGEAIMGANIFKDLFAGIRDIVGGRTSAYEKELKKAKGHVLDEISEEAKKLGANAIVGINLDYEVLGQSMLMVVATGTAISFK